MQLGVLGHSVPAYLGWVIILYWIFVIVAIIAEDREPTTTLAWILVLVAFPFFGLILYFFAGRDWKHIVPKRQKTKMAKATMLKALQPVDEPYAELGKQLLERNEGTLTDKISRTIMTENNTPPLPVRSVDIFPSGQEFFDHLKADMKAAEKFIHLEYFIWEHDVLTKDLCDILIERLKAGVKVRLMYDWMGSLPFKKDELKAVAAAGGEVHADVIQIGSLNYRNHRKIAVIDGEIGYTGGHNVGQEYIDGGEAYPAWRDTSMRITGPGVASLQKWFAYRWLTSLGDKSMFDRQYFPAVDQSLLTGTPLMTQVVAQGVDDPYESSRRTHMLAMANAKKTLRIQSPYYVPDVGIYDSMLNAALSGVDVRFIMTGWPDHKSAFWTAQSYWPKLVEAGVHVYTYMAGFFHAKTIAIDSEICAIGTMNLDLRSLKLQRELMCWIFDPDVTKGYEAVFDKDLEQCTEITLEEMRDSSAGIKFRNSAARLGANLL